jgi:hypothetical protein
VSAAALAAGLDLFGEGSGFLTILIVICVVGPLLLWFARRAVGNQTIKDLLGISAVFLVLTVVAIAMMVVEHAGG